MATRVRGVSTTVKPGTTLTLTLSTSVAVGNCLVVHVSYKVSGANPVSSVSGCGATWQRQGFNVNTGLRYETWVGYGATSGTTVTIQLTASSNAAIASLSEWSGVRTDDSVVGGFNLASGLSGEVSNAGTITGAQAGDGLDAAIGRNTGGASSTWQGGFTAGNGNSTAGSSASSNVAQSHGWKASNFAATETPTVNVTETASWVGSTVWLRAPAATGQEVGWGAIPI